MKNVLAMILSLAMVLSLAACGGKTAQETETVPAQELPASALQILETVWAEYAEEEKFHHRRLHGCTCGQCPRQF